MPVEINITDEDIAYAEKVLLPSGLTFDEKERRPFIKNFETIDLQAVPGSGKTTALLAKLVILERKLPFPNSSGVLVLSHTNAAVDEIKDKIQKHCPKLFSYPNFIGTIQGFVDEFLAIPYYSQCYQKKPFRIDNEIYDERIKNYYNSLNQYSHVRNWLKNLHEPLNVLRKIRFDSNVNLIPEINKTEGDFPLKNKQKHTYIGIKKMKVNLMEWGYLHFDDAYFLASRYLQKFPKIKNIIQKRFAFVFVDEMQDMDTHQYQLLEDLFFDSGNSFSNFQRIGDKNQSIFNGDSKIQDLWVDRATKLELNGSHRLNENIAKIVQPFALQPIDIIGLRKNADGSDITIPPYIILYENNSKEKIIPKFAEIIKQYKENGEIPEDSNKYCAIAWNSVWEKQEDTDNVDKIRLADYYSEYSREEARKNIDYSTLESYLNFYDEDIKTLYAVRRNILNAFIKILRLEKLYDKNPKDGKRDRIFTKRNLIKYFREDNHDFYSKFKLRIFKWSFATIKGEKEQVIKEVRDFIPSFLLKFERANPAFDNKINLSKDFIENPCPSIKRTGIEVAISERRNIIKDKDIGEIQMGTVHSVKGQTHTATLYLESFYKNGYGNYESQRLRNQFAEELIKDTLIKQKTSHDYIKQSAKMVYVGFSRPTHLLCLGIHKDRFEQFLKENLPNTWKIVEIN